MTLKNIFQLENILCVHFNDMWKRLLTKVCFDASFMCLSRFVAFQVIFNDLGWWTQRCGVLSRINLRVTDQSWQTSPIESILHFEVVLVVCWHQFGKSVQVVYVKVSLFFSNYASFCHQFVYWRYSNKYCNWKAILVCICMIFWRLFARVFLMFRSCVCFYLLHFVVF